MLRHRRYTDNGAVHNITNFKFIFSRKIDIGWRGACNVFIIRTLHEMQKVNDSV